MANYENTYQMADAQAPSDSSAAQMTELNTQMTESANRMAYGTVYPEICYKLEPYITMACDLMDSSGIDVPTRQQVDEMVDRIYNEFCNTYPDMAEYMGKNMGDAVNDPPPFRGSFRPMFGFRRRGIGRDFIEALLLAELFGGGL